MKKVLLLTLCLAPLAIFQTGNAWAFPSIRDAWRGNYSTSTSSDTVNCQLCHRDSSGGDPWNDYGWAVRVKIVDEGLANIAAFQAVETFNSDNDSSSASNLAEITANTQPGWTSGANNTTHFKNGSFTLNQEPPVELGGVVLDPNQLPDIIVTPNSVDFSQVKKRRSADSDVQIENNGLGLLTVSSINLCADTSSEYSWSLGNSTIDPGISETLTITFSPTNTGVEEGCIEINSDDPDQPVTTVDVSGEGVNKVSGGGGGTSNKVFLTKVLTGESGSLNGIAEDGETLTYTVTLINQSKNQATIDVTEIVPQATVHAGADDFTCTNATAGSTCTAAAVVIPGKVKGTNGVTVLTFKVMVNTPFIDIVNTVSATGIDCNLVENICTVNTVAFQDDVTDPNLLVISPVNGETVLETGFAVHGTATDAGGIASVIVNDGSTDHPTTYNSGDDTWTVNLSGYTPGTNVTLTVTATDNSSNSNQTVNPAIVVTINEPDIVEPVLVVLSPVNGDTVAVTGFTVNGTVTDAGGIATVIVNDGTADHPASYNSGDDTWTVDLPAYPGGTDVTLTVTATDTSGNQTVNPAILVHVQLASNTTQIRHLINRISYGITPSQLASVNNGSFVLNAYQAEQLNPANCLEPADAQVPPPAIGIFSPFLTLPIETRNDLQNYAILMAAYNDCQLREVLTQFWDNHFNTDYDQVNSKSGGIASQSTAWELEENDAFRANALGNFRDLVEISAQSKAMIYYLDGITNVAGNPNENYGRELMELHTLSVDGGYTDLDVVNAAIAFTGWTVVDPDSNPLTNDSFFECDPNIHDFSDIVLDLGDGVGTTTITTPEPHDALSCNFSGQAVIDILVARAVTGEFICQKLTELLVSDNITPSVVSACETTFSNSINAGDQIAQVVDTLLTNSEFTNTLDYLDKVKTPLELTAGYLRNFDIVNSEATLSGDLNDLRSELDQMSMSLFRFNTPDGFAEQSSSWVNSGLMQRRFAFISDMAFNTSPTGDIYLDPTAFFAAHTLASTALQIVDYLMDMALQNQHTILERDTALDILNNGIDFDLETDATIKQNKLRILLAAVLSYPSYQYQ